MRGRPLHVTWEHSAEDFERMLEKERDPRRRARLEAFMMLRQGKRIRDVTEVVGADYRTVQRWVSWYRTGGIESVLRRTPGHAAPGRRPKLTPQQTRELLKEHQAGRFRSIREAVEWTSEKYGVEFTYTGMHAHIRRAQQRDTQGAPSD